MTRSAASTGPRGLTDAVLPAVSEAVAAAIEMPSVPSPVMPEMVTTPQGSSGANFLAASRYFNRSGSLDWGIG